MRFLPRFLRAALFVLPGALVLGGGASSVWAQETAGLEAGAPKPVAGVLDLNEVMARGKAARGLIAQREAFVERYQAEVAETEKELRALDQELVRQRATLPPEELAKRRQAFQDKVNIFQAQVQTRRGKLEKAFGNAMNTIQAMVIRVTKEVAERQGMNLILYRSQTFLFDPGMDITDTVLTEVDRRLPNVTMQDPDLLPDSTATEER